MKLFALQSSYELGSLIAGELGISLARHEERNFEDGEHKCRPLENVRNDHVFVIESLYGDERMSVNDKLCRLLFFIATLKDASAKHITAIVPYLCYARKDRRTKSRDPVTTRYVAQLFEAAGTDHIVTLDVHNIQAYENAFRIPAALLEAKKVFADAIISSHAGEDVVVMSPDIGGVKRAEQFQQSLSQRFGKSIPLAFMEKYRSSGEVWGETVVGDVRNSSVIIIDDLISTGGTLARCAEACTRAGAKTVMAIATHGIFTGQPDITLGNGSLQKIVVTNSIPPFRLQHAKVRERVSVLNIAPLFATAIKRLYEGGSLSALLED